MAGEVQLGGLAAAELVEEAEYDVVVPTSFAGLCESALAGVISLTPVNSNLSSVGLPWQGEHKAQGEPEHEQSGFGGRTHVVEDKERRVQSWLVE